MSDVLTVERDGREPHSVSHGTDALTFIYDSQYRGTSRYVMYQSRNGLYYTFVIRLWQPQYAIVIRSTKVQVHDDGRITLDWSLGTHTHIHDVSYENIEDILANPSAFLAKAILWS